MEGLLEIIDLIKTKITDQEYMLLMDSVSKIFNYHKSINIVYNPDAEKYKVTLIFPESPSRANKLSYSDDGSRMEIWTVNDREHRVDGPAVSEWNEFGEMIHEAWFVDGVRHREGGPALIIWATDVVNIYIQNGDIKRITVT